MLVVLMGVSGSGKTTVGELLAQQIGGTFFDGDDFHPPENVEKMRSGTPLNDCDRAGWLSALHEFLSLRQKDDTPTILACSALKQSYRDTLLAGITPPPKLVYLKGSFDTIRRRMDVRKDHYMPASLLRSQFGALEEPSGAITVDVGSAPEEIASQLKAQLGF